MDDSNRAELRAIRRFHLARMKKKARKFYPHDPKARSANNLTLCSCPMCGNPRRFGMGGKICERRHEDAFRFQIENLDD